MQRKVLRFYGVVVVACFGACCPPSLRPKSASSRPRRMPATMTRPTSSNAAAVSKHNRVGARRSICMKRPCANIRATSDLTVPSRSGQDSLRSGRRYHDASFLKALATLPTRDALSLYSEVLLKIQSHYVAEPNWKALVQRGTQGLQVAMGEETFRQAEPGPASPPDGTASRLAANRQHVASPQHPQSARGCMRPCRPSPNWPSRCCGCRWRPRSSNTPAEPPGRSTNIRLI